MKIKIIVDSSSGLTEKQANELGWGFIPLQCEIDGKTYQIGRDIVVDDYAKMWRENKKINATTAASSPAINDIEINKYLNEYDLILVYPISKFLSSQTSFLKTQFQDNNKVYIVESKRISFLILKDLFKFESQINSGVSFKDAIKHFEINNERLILIPQFNDALVKGGRLSKGAAAIAKLLKIVPLIAFDNGVLEKDSIGRVFTKSLEKTVTDMWNKNKDTPDGKVLFVLHSDNEMIEELLTKFKNIINDQIPIYTYKLPADVSIHTGIGAVAVSIVSIDNETQKKFDSLLKK
ncbi:DegV family protein [Mycoplasma sp. 332]|uniref:DegV family protein n=1 Tax=unclassified Asterococcus (in: mycoplasmas, genus) TaxID=3407551 RepID=UPI003F657DDF